MGDRIAEVQTEVLLSVISRVELEGGVAAVPKLAALRRAKLDVLLRVLEVVDFTETMSKRYGMIVADTGFSRRRIIDRMIAATALVYELPLITTNGQDFEDIKGLDLLVWPS